MRPRVDSVQLERRRDSQQWILDWVIKQTGKEQNFEYDTRQVPAEVKNYAMIPRAMHKLGAHCETIARAAEARGHRRTARELYYKAVGYYHTGQHSIFEDDNPDKIFLYERLTACFDRVIELSDQPIERVEIPWEGVTISGILLLMPGRPKAPLVLCMPGMDSIKEVFAEPGANAFIDRGMHVLSIDGPGQGASNIRKIRVTADNYERAASAAVTYLSQRPEVDPNRIAAVGTSMGSFWGTRLAALDGRVKAVATAAACYSGKRNIFEMSSPRFKQIFMYMAGIHDEAEFDRMAAEMHLEGCGRRIHCPCLMTTGEYDPLSPLQDTLALFEEMAGPKELWVLENEFHGHPFMPEVRNLGGTKLISYMADWLADALEGRLPRDLNRKVLVPLASGEGPYVPCVEDFGLRARHSRGAM